MAGKRYNSDCPDHVGPRSVTMQKPPIPLIVATNFIVSKIGYGIAFYKDALKEEVCKKAFFIDIDTNHTNWTELRKNEPMFAGLDQSATDPYFHYIKKTGTSGMAQIATVTDEIDYQGGKRNRLRGELKEHLLQFHHRHGEVVLHETASSNIRRVNWVFCLIKRPVALIIKEVCESNGKIIRTTVLKTRRDDEGVMQLQYSDNGEWFYPHDVIEGDFVTGE